MTCLGFHDDYYSSRSSAFCQDSKMTQLWTPAKSATSRFSAAELSANNFYLAEHRIRTALVSLPRPNKKVKINSKKSNAQKHCRQLPNSRMSICRVLSIIGNSLPISHGSITILLKSLREA